MLNVALTAVVVAVATAHGQTQQVLQPLGITKCVGCSTSAKKRVAVMPVRVGTLSGELGLPGDAVASRVRDSIEERLAAARGLVTLNRAQLEDVLTEQRLGTTGAFNAELAPQLGKLIPAQMLLYATVDRVDVAAQRQQHVSSAAGELMAEAASEESFAEQAENRAADWDAKAESYSNMAAMSQGGFINSAAVSSQMSRNNVDKARREAAEHRAKAADLRRRAEMARTDVSETVTTTASIVLKWRALDTSTGQVLKSGTVTKSDSQAQQSAASTSAFGGNQSSSTVRHDVLINRILDMAVQELASDCEAALATEPFRAKVVKATGDAIIINAGSNLGVSEGDTFGVRQKGETLTDPDTGLPLKAAGAPKGVIRVHTVEETVAYAKVHTSAGAIARGDELEWIGVFSVAQ